MTDICIMNYVFENNTGDFTQVRSKNHAKRIYGRMKRKGGDPHNITVHIGIDDAKTEAQGFMQLRPTRVTDDTGSTIHTF
ncbi:hypothetical protein [Corynebacterium sp.]|uniref:hypothetical protein n=1 Tax=Corynebacterium sp. TaxID=1720 RepID=UPI0028B0FA60|nr:hypothetical protein [Corynebacterium sp.]